MLITSLLILFFLVIGIITIIIIGLIATFKRKHSYWKKNRLIGVIPILMSVILLILQEFILFPENSKSDQLVFVARRDMPISAIWLGLYDDNTFELGVSSREVESSGNYTFKNDTLTLTSHKGTYLHNGDYTYTFFIKGDYIWEVKNSGIKGLKIVMDERQSKK